MKQNFLPSWSLDSKEIKPVNPKGNQLQIFIERTDAEAEAPTLWPPDVKSWITGKVPDAGKDWEQKEKGMTEDEMAGWHHWLNGHEFEQTPGDGEGQGRLACYIQSMGSQRTGQDRVTDQQQHGANFLLRGDRPTNSNNPQEGTC